MSGGGGLPDLSAGASPGVPVAAASGVAAAAGACDASARTGAVIVWRWGCVFRPRAPACGGGGTPRPERSTMTPRSAQLVERGDGEDGVPIPGRRTEDLAAFETCRLRR
jgi:hypothetical protein